MDFILLSILVAFALDLIFGDPQWFPHPVRFIGKSAVWLEEKLVHLFGRNRNSGILFTLILVGGIYLLTFAIVQFFRQWYPWVGWVVSTFLLYTCFAAKDLAVHSERVFQSLQQENLGKAKRDLSMIVGRDTAQMDEKEIVRAAVETVAENTVDGVLSPLFYAFLGGAPLAMAFKAASTLDSMVGHRTPRYEKFGWASARLDDVMNFIPARIALILFPIASFIKGLSGMNSLRIVLRDGHKSPSPNAGISEAAVAGALGVRLGGINYFGGVGRLRPYLGDPARALERQDILLVNRLMYGCALLFLVIGVIGLQLTVYSLR